VSYPVTAGSVSGTTYVFTSPNHTFAVGDAVGVWNVAPSSYNGGFTVLSTAGSGTAKTFTVKKGDSSPGTVTQSGHAEKFAWGYSVGSLHFNRVNVAGTARGAPDNAPANQCIRFGARAAPNPNAGSPGTVTGYTKQNEDTTPLNVDWWPGTLDTNSFYADPGAQGLGDFVAPGTPTSVYSVVRPVQHAAAGTVPIYVDWPNHPNTGTSRIYSGAPPGGDYVIVSNGLPIPTAIASGPGPAPVNTVAPSVSPQSPSSISTIRMSSLGVWTNTDPATVWTVTFQNNLGGTASWTNVETQSSLSPAQAGTAPMAAAPLAGYEYRAQVIANNGAAGTANTNATDLVLPNIPVTLLVESE
jgi:hypothetical protein